MASSSLFLSLFIFLSLLCYVQPFSLTLPVTKDESTHQYLTTLSYGTPVESSKFVLDLGGSRLWVDCASRNSPSSSLTPIFHRSIRCLTAAKVPDIETHSWLSSLANPVDQDRPCQIPTENTITGKRVLEGELVEDFIEGSHQLLFTCSPSLLLNGLATGAKGMVGLDRSRTSFSSQFFHSLGTQRKITLCLSPSSGVVQFGNVVRESQPGSEILRSLTFTPLVTNPDQTYPSINVNSIKIGGKKVSFNGGVAQLSTVVPYTTLQSSIYENFENAYLKAASSMNMVKVDPVGPFGLCFESNSVGGSKVPVIDLVLQSEMVKWSIYGRNSMVQVSDDVMCLGFVNGGENMKNPIVIGGYQLEDVLVQFDFDTSMVGFSSMKGSSCSDFKSGSLLAQTL